MIGVNMTNERHIEAFDIWWLRNYGHSQVLSGIVQEVARSAWDYQQETIDDLNAELDEWSEDSET